MARYPAIIVALCVGAVLGVSTRAVSAEEPYPVVRADQDAYLVGETAIVTVTNLVACAGQDVELGLAAHPDYVEAGDPAPVGDSTPLVTVAADGSASVAIPVSVALLPTDTDPVVRASCVPSGGQVRGEPFRIGVMLADVQADKKRYFSDEVAVVTLTGLASCAGQQVHLGLGRIKLSAGDPDPMPLVTVGSDGSASVRIPVGALLVDHPNPLVRGACVPGGEVMGRPRAIIVLNAPSPPGTGSGLATRGHDDSRAPTFVVLAGLAALVTGAWVVARRVR